MYALVDCNNFYASCERVFRPHLRGRAVVVLSNNDGCVVARSNEAKAMGIAMGVPAFEVRNLVDSGQVVACSSNYALYGDMSDRVKATLSAYSPIIEDYSIDEAFLDLHHMVGVDLDQHAADLRRTVLRHTGIPVSVGIACTKTIAKMANRWAKKHSGVCIVRTDTRRRALLERTAVGDVWGVGPAHAARLMAQGITTALQLAEAPEAWVRKHMTVVGARLQQELRGIPCGDLEAVAPPKQVICTSRSFGSRQEDIGDVREAVASFAASCAAKLRRQGSMANIVQVFLRTDRFRPELPQYNPSRSIALPVPSASTMEIAQAACSVLRMLWRDGYAYKKAGVIVSGIVPGQHLQTALWDDRPRAQEQSAMMAMDRVNARHGRDTVRVAAQGYSRRWKLRNAMASPAYTTSWKELIEVLC